MLSSKYLTTREAAAILGISRQALVQRVKDGRLIPADRFPTENGGYLFDPQTIEEAPARYER